MRSFAGPDNTAMVLLPMIASSNSLKTKLGLCKRVSKRNSSICVRQAPSHTKRPPGSISARQMPKGPVPISLSHRLIHWGIKQNYEWKKGDSRSANGSPISPTMIHSIPAGLRERPGSFRSVGSVKIQTSNLNVLLSSAKRVGSTVAVDEHYFANQTVLRCTRQYLGRSGTQARAASDLFAKVSLRAKYY